MTLTAANCASVSASYRDDVLEISLAGRLTAATVPQVWAGAVEPSGGKEAATGHVRSRRVTRWWRSTRGCRREARTALHIEDSGGFVALAAASIATGRSDPLPGGYRSR